MSTNKEEKEEREDNIEHKIANSINITKKNCILSLHVPRWKERRKLVIRNPQSVEDDSNEPFSSWSLSQKPE